MAKYKRYTNKKITIQIYSMISLTDHNFVRFSGGWEFSVWIFCKFEDSEFTETTSINPLSSVEHVSEEKEFWSVEVEDVKVEFKLTLTAIVVGFEDNKAERSGFEAVNGDGVVIGVGVVDFGETESNEAFDIKLERRFLPVAGASHFGFPPYDFFTFRRRLRNQSPI